MTPHFLQGIQTACWRAKHDARWCREPRPFTWIEFDRSGGLHAYDREGTRHNVDRAKSPEQLMERLQRVRRRRR